MQMKTALIIMAAGIGSRFGGGIKQLAGVGPAGEIIMDYSIHDAVEAGFNKIVFIIRRDIEKEFREVIGNRMEEICRKLNVEVEYAFQELRDLPEGIDFPEGRTKPWGTGQAVLACKNLIQEPFAVINADDYYGKQAFVKLHTFLERESLRGGMNFCMAGFILKNTLSDNGSVTRGICRVNEEGYLTGVDETGGIVRDGDGAAAVENGARRPLDADSYVSMNMWGLTPEFLPRLEKGFEEFFERLSGNEQKGEYLLPIFIDELLKNGEASVKVLETPDRWFGVTYQEDRAAVAEAFAKLTAEGEYSTPLFEDLMKKQA